MSLYPPPEDIKTEVFARVPDTLRRSGGRPGHSPGSRACTRPRGKSLEFLFTVGNLFFPLGIFLYC